jgi:predicted dehydrogenase
VVLAGTRAVSAAALGANDRIRIGVIGTGGRARGLMRNLKDLPGQQIVAVSDVYEPRMLEAAEIPATKAATVADYRRILDDKEVDAVLIGAPDHWHKTMTLEALAAGKDIYVEKPVSHSLEEGEEMCISLGPPSRSCRRDAAAELGPLDPGQADRGFGEAGPRDLDIVLVPARPTGPLPEVDTSKLTGSAGSVPPATGPSSPSGSCAGATSRRPAADVTDLLTHWIDVVHWYMGVEAPLAATTIGRSYRMKTWEWPDAATATLEASRRVHVTHNGSYGSSVDDGGLELRGEKGTLKIDRQRLLVYKEGAPKAAGQYAPEPEIHVRSQGDGTVSHLRNWLDCIRTRRTPNASMRIGHQAVRAAHIANAALGVPGGVRFDARTGKIEPLR